MKDTPQTPAMSPAFRVHTMGVVWWNSRASAVTGAVPG